MKVLKPNFKKRGGLITVVAQDIRTREILMLAYANEAAWRLTLETGIATYYSTSREKIWVKGEESGNSQRVWDVLIDCDGDALVYLVESLGEGVACHTGARSCFYRSVVGRDLGVTAPREGSPERLETTESRVRLELVSSN